MEKLKAAEERGNYAEFREELKKLLPEGTEESKVVCVLDELAWHYQYSQPHNAYTASKKLKGSILHKSQARISVFLDDEKKVIRLTVHVTSTSLFG